jgi:hypothetical protein
VTPRYRVGDQTFRRKNDYLPCAIAERVDDMSNEEYVRVQKAAYWVDSITAAEWKVILGEDGCSPSARSRLKRKAAGWLVALGRIAMLDVELYNEIAAQSRRLYREQIGERHPLWREEEDAAA